MNYTRVESLISEWDDVYKKGQLSLWVLLAIYDGKKFAAEIQEFLYAATDEAFEVKEQSLYRALRRFKSMGLVKVSEEESPNGGPKRKVYSLTDEGILLLSRFIDLHISPLFKPDITNLLRRAKKEGETYEKV